LANPHSHPGAFGAGVFWQVTWIALQQRSAS
jgi:hypothetical protein